MFEMQNVMRWTDGQRTNERKKKRGKDAVRNGSSVRRNATKQVNVLQLKSYLYVFALYIFMRAYFCVSASARAPQYGYTRHSCTVGKSIIRDACDKKRTKRYDEKLIV